jgi:hypothetical protein
MRRYAALALGIAALVACSDDEASTTGASSTTSQSASSTSGTGGAGGAMDMAPPAPSNLMLSIVGEGIHVIWTDNADNEDSFILERKDGDDASFVAVGSPLPFDTTQYHDEPLTAGVTYAYRVAASNAAGMSPYSNEASLMKP